SAARPWAREAPRASVQQQQVALCIVTRSLMPEGVRQCQAPMKEIEDRERRGRMRTLEVTAEQPHDGALQGPNRTRDEVEPRGKRLGWLTARLPRLPARPHLAPRVALSQREADTRPPRRSSGAARASVGPGR